jgi:hypothetical protein
MPNGGGGTPGEVLLVGLDRGEGSRGEKTYLLEMQKEVVGGRQGFGQALDSMRIGLLPHRMM